MATSEASSVNGMQSQVLSCYHLPPAVAWQVSKIEERGPSTGTEEEDTEADYSWKQRQHRGKRYLCSWGTG